MVKKTHFVFVSAETVLLDGCPRSNAPQVVAENDGLRKGGDSLHHADG